MEEAPMVEQPVEDDSKEETPVAAEATEAKDVQKPVESKAPERAGEADVFQKLREGKNIKEIGPDADELLAQCGVVLSLVQVKQPELYERRKEVKLLVEEKRVNNVELLQQELDLLHQGLKV